MAGNEEPKQVEEAKEEVQAAPVTPATIRKDLVEELELLGDRAMGKLTAYARQSLSVISSVLDGFEDDRKPPAKDVPTKTEG